MGISWMTRDELDQAVPPTPHTSAATCSLRLPWKPRRRRLDREEPPALRKERSMAAPARNSLGRFTRRRRATGARRGVTVRRRARTARRRTTRGRRRNSLGQFT
jgi:hypothetical protein